MHLYYIHDPMCSWCWAFQPVWKALQERLPTAIGVSYLLGGLAPDNYQPMSLGLQRQIQQHWRTIQQQVPSTMFNFEFWQQNTPRRSTYPACRAVLAAKYQDKSYEDAMILAIQHAYYLQAKNPSDDEVLQACAASLNLDVARFEADFHSHACREELLLEIHESHRLGVYSFPSLLLDVQGKHHAIAVNYTDISPMLEEINAKI